MADSPLIGDMAASLLADAAASLAAPPSRQLVTWYASTIAVDCDQLVVSVVDLHRSQQVRGFGAGIPREPRQQPSIPVAVFDVRLSLGCWPAAKANGDPPSAASITAAAETALNANYTMWHAISSAATAGTLFDDITDLGGGCIRAQVDAWTPTGPPAGQYVTGHFPVQVSVMPMP